MAGILQEERRPFSDPRECRPGFPTRQGFGNEFVNEYFRVFRVFSSAETHPTSIQEMLKRIEHRFQSAESYAVRIDDLLLKRM